MFHMVRFLGERFDIDLVAPAFEAVDEAKRLLQGSCREMEFVPPSPGSTRRRLLRLSPYETDPALAAAIRTRLARQCYAAVQVEKPAMLPYVPPDTPIPIVLDSWAFGLAGILRALRYEPGMVARARNVLRLLRFSAFDAFCWPAIDSVLVVSEVDRQRCLRSCPGQRTLIVANGVDCTAIRPGACRDSGPPVLTFTGDMSFTPNVDAALFLASQIFPALRQVYADVELHLVGRKPDPRVRALQGPGITVTGEVDQMLPYLHATTVYVAPHFTGAGTRTKILEAMAAGLPIVTTSIGLEGIEALPGRAVLIADDPSSMVTAILKLLADPTQRHLLGSAARRLAEERYDWRRCLAPLESLYTALLASRTLPC